MKRSIALLVCVSLVGVALYDTLFAQPVVEPVTVVEPAVVTQTYIPIPPPQPEVITVAPSPKVVWLAGHWDRTPDDWQWVAGNWVQPPFSNAYWVPGYWQHQGGQFVWEDAHWAAANTGLVVNKPVVVPAVYEEPQPVQPAGTTNVIWQAGHWEWRGTWVWVAGEYVANSVSTAVWVPGEWTAAAGGTWAWTPAHWAAR